MPIEQHPFTTNRWLQNIEDPLIRSKWFISENHEGKNLPLSFAYMPNKNVKSIILGTFPIWQISSGPFPGNPNMEYFYGSVANNFWDCLGSITGNDVNNLNDRLGVLNNSKIGITDILGKIKRDPNHCNSDKCITAINYNDILILKEHFPALKNIFVTSGGRGPVLNLNGNNGNAARWLKNSVANQNISGFNQPGFVKSISINQIEFNLVYLFSPSKTANRYLKRKMNEHNNFGIQNLSIQEFRKMQWAYFLRTYHFGENVNFTIDGLWNTVINNHYLVDFFD